MLGRLGHRHAECSAIHIIRQRVWRFAGFGLRGLQSSAPSTGLAPLSSFQQSVSRGSAAFSNPTGFGVPGFGFGTAQPQVSSSTSGRSGGFGGLQGGGFGGLSGVGAMQSSAPTLGLAPQSIFQPSVSTGSAAFSTSTGFGSSGPKFVTTQRPLLRRLAACSRVGSEADPEACSRSSRSSLRPLLVKLPTQHSSTRLC